MHILSILTGTKKPLVVDGKTLRTAIDRHPVAGPIRLTSTGLAGDETGHPQFHGGPERALLFVAQATAQHFEPLLGRPLPPGTFGENVRIEGCDDRDVRIGDVFRWGDVLVQATSARTPCGTLARHMGVPDIVEEIGRPHRAGWYLRVLREGVVQASDPITFEDRGPAEWTIERAAAVFTARKDVVGAQGLLRVAALSSDWREWLEKRLAGRW